MLEYDSLGGMFLDLIPIYKGKSWRPFIARFPWDASIVDFMEELSPRRCQTRKDSYLIPGELDRAALMNEASSSGASIRFGHSKTGRGFVGGRKDFCLIGGAYRGKGLTLFYRRLELLGGLFTDTVVINEIEKAIGPIKTVTIMAVQADVFAREGGSNAKLYAQLKRLYR